MRGEDNIEEENSAQFGAPKEKLSDILSKSIPGFY